MRGSRQIIPEIAFEIIGRKLIPEILQQTIHGLFIQIIECHQQIRLFRYFVLIRALPFGLQNTIHAVNILVFCPIGFPIQLFQIEVPLILGNNAVFIDVQGQFSGYIRHPGPLITANARFLNYFLTAQLKNFRQLAEHPGQHQIGVGIVGESAFRRTGCMFMKFVRSHHTGDIIAVRFFIPDRFAYPETGNFNKHLRSVLLHETGISGNMIILPGIVGNGQ